MELQTNYIVKAYFNTSPRLFVYEDAMDVWEALEKFYREDYCARFGYKTVFDIDVLSMDGNEVIKTYSFTFTEAIFHAFYDKGHIASGEYTLDQFSNDISRKGPKAVILFGSDAINRYEVRDFDGMRSSLECFGGAVVARSFKTDAEKKAYMQGLDDGDGWPAYKEVKPDDQDKVQAIYNNEI